MKNELRDNIILALKPCYRIFKDDVDKEYTKMVINMIDNNLIISITDKNNDTQYTTVDMEGLKYD